MSFNIRQASFPADFIHQAEVVRQTRPEPVSAEELEKRVSELPAGTIREVVLAFDEGGAPLGYAIAFHHRDHKPGLFSLYVNMVPSARRQGIGSALARAAQEVVSARGGTHLRGEVKEADTDTMAFAKGLGFDVVRHIYESRLDLATFDPAPFAGVVDAVKDMGIRFFTLDQHNTEAVQRSFYELCRENLLDNPAEDAQDGFEPFEEWRSFVIEGGLFPHDCMLLAADGDRIVSAVVLEPRKGPLYNRVAVTARSHRGRQLALALKLLAVDVGLRYGAPYLYTENDSLNAPILAINRKMGYVPHPGTYYVEKRI